jgi:hypothetical protein
MLAGAVDQPPPGSQYAGGLDRVRTDGTKPRGFQWLTRPMLVSMLGLAILAGFGIPTINAYQPPVAGPLLTFIRSAAEPHEQHVTVSGRAATLEDPTGDQSGEVLLATDIVTADYAFMPVVPAWLLGEVLNCMSLTVVCASSRGDLFSFSQGAMVFLQRMVAAPEGLPSGRSGEWGPMLAGAGNDAAPLTPRMDFPGANLAVITSLRNGAYGIRVLEYDGRRFIPLEQDARSRWVGADLLTLVPIGSAFSLPIGWDAYASISDRGAPGRCRDRLREHELSPLLDLEETPFLEFVDVTAG